MIQDIFPSRLHNEYHPEKKAGEDSIIMIFDGDRLLVSKCDEKRFPGKEAVMSEPTFLFSIDDKDYYLGAGIEAIDGEYEYKKISELRYDRSIASADMFAIYTAKHLSDWYRDNCFCGRCGRAMKHSDTERCMICECGYHSYPRIMPAVIVGVTDGDRIVLTKYRRGFAHNALIAGFVEIGETAEECVKREVMEEVGLRVKNITYYKSQPWGSANDLLLGFFCEVDGDRSIRMDAGELKSACWTKREDIVLQPDNYSLTNEMMSIFKDGRI